MYGEQGQRLGLAATSSGKKHSKTKGKKPSENGDNANAGNTKSASVSPKGNKKNINVVASNSNANAGNTKSTSVSQKGNKKTKENVVTYNSNANAGNTKSTRELYPAVVTGADGSFSRLSLIHI